MADYTLERARAYEAENENKVSEIERPLFHVTGGVGWINDPNGFSVYQGEYHLFYQYHPYSVQWGPMHWGHVKTKDFIQWERLPIAMAPDTSYDYAGCFSGSAVELDDGRQLLMYTGVTRQKDEHGTDVDCQRQCVAVGDGINFEKYEKNPVIDTNLIPEDGSKIDFRDPKIWKENGRYYCVTVNRLEDDCGGVLLYESEDAFKWHYVGVLERSCNEYGTMWECPDFFELDGKRVLLVSPMEMHADGLEFHAGHGTAAFIGTYDWKTHKFDREHVQAIDYGLDFYAPQTLETMDGRRIMIAWMKNWATCGCVPRERHIWGAMTIPRELSVKDGRLIQNPVRELMNYRGKKVEYEQVLIHGEESLEGISGRILDMTVTLDLSKSDAFKWFRVNVAKGGNDFSVIQYDSENRTIRIDRSHSGFPYDIVHVRDFVVKPVENKIKLRFIMDRYSLELFVNDGEQAATMNIYTPLSADKITFETDGNAVIDIEKYSLNIR